MHRFSDANGFAWEVAINVHTVRRVRDILKVNIPKLAEDGAKPLGELLGDPVTLVDVLFVLCELQAKAAGISDEAFGRAMNGDTLEAAASAFVDEFILFSPSPKARKLLRALMSKGREVQTIMMDKAELELAALTPEILASKFTTSFGNPPASSASTPVLSQSAN